MILLQYGSDIGTFSPPDVNSHKHIHGKTTIKTTILMNTQKVPIKWLPHDNIDCHVCMMKVQGGRPKQTTA